MTIKHYSAIEMWILLVLANHSAFGQQAGAAQGIAPLAVAASAPTITILTATTGAALRSAGAASATLDLGAVSYFGGTKASGTTSQKNPQSLVISTRFALRVDCPGNLSSSQVDLTVSRSNAATSHTVAVDGITLGSVAQPITRSVPCGSTGEHRLDVEVPVSTPPGSIGSTIAFTAKLR